MGLHNGLKLQVFALSKEGSGEGKNLIKSRIKSDIETWATGVGNAWICNEAGEVRSRSEEMDAPTIQCRVLDDLEKRAFCRPPQNTPDDAYSPALGAESEQPKVI